MNIMNAVLRGCKATRKVHRRYLAFKNLKTKGKQGNKSKKRLETSEIDAFEDQG